MYKEVRDTHLNGAIETLYTEMAGKHRARASAIQIIKTGVVSGISGKDGSITSGKNVRREGTKMFLNSKIKFPLPHVVSRPAEAQLRSSFKASRPTTIFG